jgi:hypothetical protein
MVELHRIGNHGQQPAFIILDADADPNAWKSAGETMFLNEHQPHHLDFSSAWTSAIFINSAKWPDSARRNGHRYRLDLSEGQMPCVTFDWTEP